MKKMKSITFLVQTLVIVAFGQNPAFELTFTAVDSAAYISLDSIKIINRTQGGDTLLYWPDTVLVFDYQTGIPNLNIKKEEFRVFQNVPNPVKDQTTITIYIPEKDRVCVMISDVLGRQVIKMERVLDMGYHSYKFTPGDGDLYCFIAQWKGNSSSIKILNASSHVNCTSSLEYKGSKPSVTRLKATENIDSFSFSLGDELLYIGFADNLQSGILDVPETSATHSFQFAYNIPCPGMPTVTLEGQEYNTVQIFSQCWLKENLNVGSMILGSQEMQDNGLIEKYCYNDYAANCDTYGGLYKWDEGMQYTSVQGVQGICPQGWHIPTDEELMVLEGAVDSQYSIGDPVWDGWDFRGFDACYRLKTGYGWSFGGNGIDSHGFSALPAGLRYYNGTFIHEGNHAYFISSNENTGNYSWNRLLYIYMEINRLSLSRDYGLSIRCIRD